MLKKSNPSICSHFLPGLLLSFIVAAVAKVLALWLPQLGGGDFGDFIRDRSRQYVLQSKTVCARNEICRRSRLLEYSVVLLGFTVTFQTISEMGIRGFVFIVLMMTIVITAAYLIGKEVGIQSKNEF